MAGNAERGAMAVGDLIMTGGGGPEQCVLGIAQADGSILVGGEFTDLSSAMKNWSTVAMWEGNDCYDRESSTTHTLTGESITNYGYPKHIDEWRCEYCSTLNDSCTLACRGCQASK